MGASKLLHRILKFINYANLFKINEKCHLSSIQKSQQICTSGGDVYYASRNLQSTCFYDHSHKLKKRTTKNRVSMLLFFAQFGFCSQILSLKPNQAGLFWLLLYRGDPPPPPPPPRDLGRHSRDRDKILLMGKSINKGANL